MLTTFGAVLSLHDLAAAMTGCRWPLWPHDAEPDHRYCGATRTRPGGSYCAAHAAKAYVTPGKPTKPPVQWQFTRPGPAA